MPMLDDVPDLEQDEWNLISLFMRCRGRYSIEQPLSPENIESFLRAVGWTASFTWLYPIFEILDDEAQSFWLEKQKAKSGSAERGTAPESERRAIGRMH